MSSRSSKSVSSKTSKSTNKQSHEFNRDWLSGTRKNWLRYDSEERGMYCIFCQKHNKRPFDRDSWSTIPCKRLRKESLIRYEECQAHRDSVKLEQIASKTNVSSAIAPTLPEKRMKQAFCCLYFLAKHRIPHTTNFEPF